MAVPLVSLLLFGSALVAVPVFASAENLRDPNQSLERTSFQSARGYDDTIDIKSDVAMVYGIDRGLPQRIETWRREGYIIHVMTGVSWGNYQDYLYGRFDGKKHLDAAQTEEDGRKISHGGDVYYMVPELPFGEFLCIGVKRAIDAGALAIHLEEPEFWVRAGYSPAFQREWLAYYGDAWIPPHLTPDAQYRASKLKYFLYRRALGQVFAFAHEYGKKIGRDVRCYVPTHSMLNYAQWRIVSPEQSLMQIEGCNGYVGQVWTGTARTPNVYRRIVKERTFETALCEYGVLHNLVRSTGRRMWYLNDPLEDNPRRTWEDYKRNWECTLVASLLWPDVWRFEVMPWPNRVFHSRHRMEKRDADGNPIWTKIPPDYASEILTVTQVLNDMRQSDVEWDCGTRGIGILVSDTLMFERGGPEPSDRHLSNFYGIALPLIKAGSPVEPVQMENIGIKDYLAPYRILFLTYEGMKPPSPELHKYLASWVRAGGVLVLLDADDAFCEVKEWWNTGKKRYASPTDHLFEQLGCKRPQADKEIAVGHGWVLCEKRSPTDLAYEWDGADEILRMAARACRLAGLTWKPTNTIHLRRGPYHVVSVLDESVSDKPFTIKGHLVNLFEPDLPVLKRIVLPPGSRALLLDLDRIDKTPPFVIASSSKILGEQATDDVFRFHSEGPKDTLCRTRIALPRQPKSVTVRHCDPKDVREDWDNDSKTLLLTYPNSAKGWWVEVRF